MIIKRNVTFEVNMKLCKHCQKPKAKHQRETLFCPSATRSLAAAFNTEVVYNEYETDPVHCDIALVRLHADIKEIKTELDKLLANGDIDERTHAMNISNATMKLSYMSENSRRQEVTNPNAVLVINFDGEQHSYDVEWNGNTILDGEHAVGDLYFTDKFKMQLDSCVELSFIVSDESGVTSSCTYNSERCEFTSDDNRDELLKEDVVEDISTGTGALSDLNIDDFVLPLQNKQWVLNNIRSNSDDETERLDYALEGFDGSIILGKPDTKNNGTYLMFGMKSGTGFLDDFCLLDNILFKEWQKLNDSGFIEIGIFESHTNVDESEVKGITAFMSEVIGRSLQHTNAVDLKTSAHCKAFLEQEYDVEKAKRIKKEKWGQIEYRLFESDEGRHYTLVSYNDKLISHYAFAYNEDY